MTHKSAKFETFLSSFSHWHVKGFSSKRTALKTDVVGPETDVVGPETRCLQELPCTIQPGNVTGWGSEGVKMALIAAQSCESVWPSGKALGW